MLYLLRCAVRGEQPEAAKISNMDYERLWKDSCFHKLEPMIYRALSMAEGVPDAVLALFKEAKEKSARKNAMMDIERMQLEAWMEQQGIWYVPLKGIVIQNLYPGSGLRKMADNDLWFDSKYQENVRDYFLERGYRVNEYGKGNHDVYFKDPIYNFELHRDLFIENYNPLWTKEFAKIQERLQPMENKVYGRKLSKEDFYCYYIAHAYHHHEDLGGIGLKAFLDIYYYLEAFEKEMDMGYLVRELDVLGLREYEATLRSVSKKLFSEEGQPSGEMLSEEERTMLQSMMEAGAYGIFENVVDRKMGDGKLFDKLRYYKRRLAPDEWFLKAYYPFFYRHKWLRPVGNAYRVVRGLVRHPQMLLHEWKRVWSKKEK